MLSVKTEFGVQSSEFSAWKTGGRDAARVRVCSQLSTLRCYSGQALNSQLSSRGQTLVLVVLIMLVIALLAALLVAVIISNQARIGRSGNIAALNNTVEAGLRYADYQLTYSADGADWRPALPTDANPFPYTFGRGQFKLALSYDPSGGGELANFIKIECTARLLDTKGDPIPTLRRSRIAYKPVLLADYLRFITNKDRSSLPAVLGVPSVLQGSSEVAYATTFTGPIRSNADIKWTRTATSDLAVYLFDNDLDNNGFRRSDRIETAGEFKLADGANSARVFCWTGAWSGAIATYASSANPFYANLNLGDGILRYVDGVNRGDNNSPPLQRNVRYQEPPSINTTDPTTGQSRYLLLTRDSGTWRPDASSNWYNTGWYGYGQGIYVGNINDIQDNHDLTALRNKWMTPTPNSNYATTLIGWDTAGWSYTPPGVEIILHPNDYSATLGLTALGVNTIEIIRHDSGVFRKWDGTALSAPSDPLNPQGGPYDAIQVSGTTIAYGNQKYLLRAYPENGVIYAEGNVRVAGVLPPGSWASPPVPSSLIDPDDGRLLRYYYNASNRYYDLSIVSGGTIYIEGDIMSPNTYIANYNLAYDPDQSLVSSDRNTRLALLARDNVCLNMTAFGARLDASVPATAWKNTETPKALGITGIEPLTFNFRSFQPALNEIAYFWHSGKLNPLSPNSWGTPNSTPPPAEIAPYYYTEVVLKANGTNSAWDARTGGTDTTFSFNLYDPTPSLSASNRVFNAAAGVDWEVSVRDNLRDTSGNSLLQPNGYSNTLEFSLDATSTHDYRLAGFNILPSQINIDALIFAQEGSWFVLPGPWFNGTWGPPSGNNYLGQYLSNDVVVDTSSDGVPSYRMALGSIPLSTTPANRPHIYFNGAITESHTAALGDAHDWLSKWSGPGALVSYTFDGGLRTTPYYDANGNKLPRIPKLPCPPGLIIWGKQ